MGFLMIALTSCLGKQAVCDHHFCHQRTRTHTLQNGNDLLALNNKCHSAI